MKLIVLTESLIQGGAERQVSTLAAALKGRGHDVRVVTYASGDFYKDILASGRVEHVFLGGKSSGEWAGRVRRYLRQGWQDVVLAFLPGPCGYAELAAMPCRKWGLVVSERAAIPLEKQDFRYKFQAVLHSAADRITTNSHANREGLEKLVPWLKGRITTIYNTVDRNRFFPDESGTSPNPVVFRYLVAARINAQKNIPGLVRALKIVHDESPAIPFVIDWFGRLEKDDEALFREASAMAASLGVRDMIRFHPPTPDIAGEYKASHAVLLPSFYEGLPNTICEAMACGKPVLMSDVCDARHLVEDGGNGFLFSPNEPAKIAGALIKFTKLSPEKRLAMGRASYERSLGLFDEKVVIDAYEKLLKGVIHENSGH